MSQSVATFYDNLAEAYRYIFPNWNASIQRQGITLNDLLTSRGYTAAAHTLYDCTCGIGTQVFGLALHGWRIHGTDLSPKAIELATEYTSEFDVEHIPTFDVMDLLNPSPVDTQYDVVISMDNAVPHFMNDDDLTTAITTMWNFLKDDGLVMIGIRDYDKLAQNPPNATFPSISDIGEGRHIIFQTWDWAQDVSSYKLNIYITQHIGDRVTTQCFPSEYRALKRDTLTRVLKQVGFDDIQWIMPEESGSYQPIVTAKKS